MSDTADECRRPTSGVTFRNVQWLGAGIRGGLFGRAHLEDCRFEGVGLDSIRYRKVDFVNCHFESVTFGEHYFGNITDCTFFKCMFVGCRFDAVAFEESTLRSCQFDGMRGERTRWRECLFEDVVLSGHLAKCTSIGNRFRRVDMSSAELIDSSLVYTREDDVKLPDRPDNFAIDARLFLDAEQTLSSRLEPAAFEAYRRLAKEWAPFGAPFIVDGGVVGEMPPAARDLVLATLFEMRQRRPIWSSASRGNR